MSFLENRTTILFFSLLFIWGGVILCAKINQFKYSMKNQLALFITGSFIVALSAQAQTLINFDDLPAGTIVSNQYSGVVFSSDSGNVLETLSLPSFSVSSPNVLGGYQDASINGYADVFLNFSTPVNDLSFYAVVVNDTGTVGLIDIYQDNTLTTTVNLIGNGNFNVPDYVDLSAYSDVTEIEIHSITDNGGYGYDNVQFTPIAAPEPSMIALSGLGLAGLVAARRRK